MKAFRIRPSGPLRGRVEIPSDKSIGHRALMLASLAEGFSRLRRFQPGLDHRSTRAAFERMGVRFRELGPELLEVEGLGLEGLKAPSEDLDCGNSGTTMRLLSGLLAAQPFASRLVGDASLERRPMGRVIKPLRQRGARIEGRPAPNKSEEWLPPLAIAGVEPGRRLGPIDYDLPVASAQVKSALLLSGLYAEGPTVLREPSQSRDHSERMLLALDVPVRRAGEVLILDPSHWRRGWEGFDWEIPGDPSSAAFFAVAAQLVEGSEVTLETVSINPTRTGLFDAMRHMEAGVEFVPKGVVAGDEAIADIVVHHKRAKGGEVAGELVVRMIDEIPILSALAALAEGRTEIRDAAELRVKESDRIATMAQVLRAFGVECEERSDGMVIEGGAKLQACRVRSHGDHRIAMSAAVLGLVAEGETWVEDTECVATSFPGFVESLRALGGDIVEETLP